MTTSTPLQRPALTTENNVVCLSGLDPKPRPLWDMNLTFLKAQENVAHAQKLSPDITAIFLGAEHLKFLQDQPLQNKVVVIEPCALYFEMLSVQNQIHAPLKTVSVICGEWGMLSAKYFPTLNKLPISQELTFLAYQLTTLPDEFFEKVQIFGIAERDKVDPPFYNLLHKLLTLIQSAKLFHQKHQPLYANIAQKNADHAFAILHNKQQGPGWFTGKHLKALMGDPNLPGVQLSNRDSDAGFGQKIDDFVISEPDLASYLENASRFVHKIQNLKPAALILENRTPFLNLEDVLIYERLFFECGIHLWSVWYDWIMQQSIHTGKGGFSTLLHLALSPWKNNTTHVSVIDQMSLTRMQPDWPFKACHFDYPEAQNPVPPVSHPDQIERDVAIIHHPRLISIIFNEVNEIYEMVKHFTGNREYGDGVSNFLIHLRQHLKRHAPSPKLAHSFDSLVGYIDFLYYNQNRLRQVLAFVNTQKHFKITLYGKEWDKIAPREICAGHIYGEKNLHQVYRTSLITADFTQVNSEAHVQFTVPGCLSAGGLPIIFKPYFQAHPDDPRARIFTKNMFSFSTADELAALVDHFKNNLEQRQSYIQKSQSGWLKNIWHKNSLKELIQGELVIPHEPAQLPPTFTGQMDLDHFVLMAAEGYLWSIAGFPFAALSIWREIVRQPGAPVFAPLLERIQKTEEEQLNVQ